MLNVRTLNTTFEFIMTALVIEDLLLYMYALYIIMLLKLNSAVPKKY